MTEDEAAVAGCSMGLCLKCGYEMDLTESQYMHPECEASNPAEFLRLKQLYDHACNQFVEYFMGVAKEKALK